MLERFFSDPEVAQRLRRGCLGPHLDSYAASVHALGYARSTARVQLGLLAELGRWLERRGIPVADLDEQVAERFLNQRRRRCGGLGRSDAASCSRFLAHLRKDGVVAPAESRFEESVREGLTRRCEAYLRRERGLEQATVDAYRPFVRRFLIDRFGNRPLRLKALEPPEISSFVQGHAHSMAPKRAQLMVSVLRSFFRFPPVPG